MRTRIVITGAGIVSAIGNNKLECLASIKSGHTGIDEVKYLKTSHHEFPVGEVKLSNDEMSKLLRLESLHSRTTLMGIMAVREALEQAKIDISPLRKVLISGTTVGGMDTSERILLGSRDKSEFSSLVSIHTCGASTNGIASYFKDLFQSTITTSTACSSALNSIIMGCNMLQAGLADVVVAGGSESLSLFHLNGFKSLMILDQEICRPFDENRRGLNLGEGAAFVVLESEQSAAKRGAKALAHISGYANACDAFHQTATSEDGEGAYLAMSQALKHADLSPCEIDYINAHGTATPNNDISEMRAIKRVFGDNLPWVSSTKSLTGHTTSASGSIETVISLLALENQFIPMNFNCDTPIEQSTCIVRSNTQAPLRNVMCNSFGFGGNDSSIILTSIKEDCKSGLEHSTLPSQHSPLNVELGNKIYIKSISQISAQQPLSDIWFDNPIFLKGEYTHACDPDFKQFLNPMASRRMTPVLKRSLVTAKEALKSLTAGEEPQAIITGTGLGCMASTEKLIDAMIAEGEAFSLPTHFMQSTHNAIGSIVAINNKCHAYNATYSQNGISGECAFLDAFLQMRLGRISNALVCSHDELSPMWCDIQLRAEKEKRNSTPLSEAASTFLLSTHADGALCEISALDVTFGKSFKKMLENLSAHHDLSTIDAIMLSCASSQDYNANYVDLVEAFTEVPVLHYKHLFGQSHSAAALGIYACALCLYNGKVPAFLMDREQSRSSFLFTTSTLNPKSILFANCDGDNKSLMLLKSCD